MVYVVCLIFGCVFGDFGSGGLGLIVTISTFSGCLVAVASGSCISSLAALRVLLPCCIIVYCCILRCFDVGFLVWCVL